MNKIISKKDKALFAELVRTDFKLRYQGSVLGYLWSLLKPLMLFGILFIVFTKFLNLGRGVPNYPQSLLLGIVLWTFFVEATNMSLKSIVARGSLIRKISIPRYMIPLSVVASAFINMALNMVVVLVFILFAPDNALSWSTLIILPLLILELLIFSVGVGFFLAALYVKFRDLDPIWEIVRQALFYTIPIIYPLSAVPLNLQKIIILNPIAQIIQSARNVTAHASTTTIFDVFHGRLLALLPLVIVVLVFVSGLAFFNKQARYFAENV